jgi:transposase
MLWTGLAPIGEASRRLDEIPGVSPALATALVASIADPKVFRSGRDFSARVELSAHVLRKGAILAENFWAAESFL